jgi:hypothetical protein
MSTRGKKVGVSKKKAITKKGKGKKEKDPNMPKRPKTGYIFFSAEERVKVKEDNPSLGFGDITKQVSAKWKEMTDDDKEPYLKLAQQDKERYEKEMSKFKSSAAASRKKKKADSDDDEDDDDDDDSDE